MGKKNAGQHYNAISSAPPGPARNDAIRNAAQDGYDVNIYSGDSIDGQPINALEVRNPSNGADHAITSDNGLDNPGTVTTNSYSIGRDGDLRASTATIRKGGPTDIEIGSHKVGQGKSEGSGAGGGSGNPNSGGSDASTPGSSGEPGSDPQSDIPPSEPNETGKPTGEETGNNESDSEGSDIPEEQEGDSDAKDDNESKGENGDGESEDKGGSTDGNVSDPCNYCTSDAEGWEQYVPILGPAKGALHDLTNGIHSGNVWQIANGIFGLVEAASDVMMVSGIVRKLAKGAFKAALKEILQQIGERVKGASGGDSTEAGLEEMANQLGLEGEQREFFMNAMSAILDLNRNKPKPNQSPNSHIDANPKHPSESDAGPPQGNDGPIEGPPALPPPPQQHAPQSQLPGETQAPAKPGTPDDHPTKPDDNDPKPSRRQRIANVKKENQRQASISHQRAANAREAAKAEPDLAKREALEKEARKHESDAHGPETENKVIDALGDDVQDASVPLKPKGEIDIVTKSEAIEVKSGRQTPSTDQLNRLQDYAKENGKSPVVYFENWTPNQIKHYENTYPDIEFRHLSKLGI